MIDDIVLKTIVDSVEIKNKTVLEIGPGTGNLTDYILNKNPKKTFVIEKDYELAEKLKIIHGSTEVNQLDNFKNIDVNIINEKGELTSQNFPKSMLIGIIKPRVEEIFELVIQNLENSYPEYTKISKVIITGGTSNLHGINNIAKSYFKCNVRIGKPIGLLNAPDLIQSPSFSCLTALVLKSSREQNNNGLYSFFKKLREYFFN